MTAPKPWTSSRGGAGPVPKVVLLDLQLPKVDGLEVLRLDFEAFARAVSDVGLYWLLLNQPPQ